MTESAGYDGPEAAEADVVEQSQGLDGRGSVTPEDVAPDEATEADVLEQGAHVTPE